jgi:hypothetical protein
MQVYNPISLSYGVFVTHHYLTMIAGIGGSSAMKESPIVPAASRADESVVDMSLQSNPHGKTKKIPFVAI